MTEFIVRQVTLDNVTKHDNADSLSIAMIDGGYPVVIRTDEYPLGSSAVYIPVDALVPVDRPEFSFLVTGNGTYIREGRTYARIKARRFRGVFSMGLLVPAPTEPVEDLQKHFEILKYETPEETACTYTGPIVRKPKFNEIRQEEIKTYSAAAVLSLLIFAVLPLPIALVTVALVWAAGHFKVLTFKDRAYTPNVPVYDIDGYRKYKSVFKEGEPVSITEKIHGCNARYVFTKGRLHIGSRTMFRRDIGNVWAQAAEKYNLAKILSNHPDKVLFGEVYGKVQDLKYGVPNDVRFAAFDLMDLKTRGYLNPIELKAWCVANDIPTVPELYVGPWSSDLEKLAEGKTTMTGDHVREGIVIKPLEERKEPNIGRCFLKLVGEGYMTRKTADA